MRSLQDVHDLNAYRAGHVCLSVRPSAKKSQFHPPFCVEAVDRNRDAEVPVALTPLSLAIARMKTSGLLPPHVRSPELPPTSMATSGDYAPRDTTS
jgi:hypothetical protein